jgi:hypothetical protein
LLLLDDVRDLVCHQSQVVLPLAACEEDMPSHGESACSERARGSRGGGVRVDTDRRDVDAEACLDRSGNACR